jgi:hypothetical protein
VSLQRSPFRDFTAEEFLGRTLTTCRGAGGCVSVFQGSSLTLRQMADACVYVGGGPRRRFESEANSIADIPNDLGSGLRRSEPSLAQRKIAKQKTMNWKPSSSNSSFAFASPNFAYGVPNLPRYSPDKMNDLTISEERKSPPKAFSLFSQNWYPASLESGASVGFRRR